MSVVLLVWTLRKPAPQVPCFFVFGDCLFDEGINNHLNTPAKVNNLTYGIDSFTGASGSRTIRFRKLHYMTNFGVGGCNNFPDGVNYGLGGGGILDITGSHN
ncbi:GDSL-LIKE LIPASE/ACYLHYDROLASE-RELATED [Salix viminalis]|uniref:GDSL-LIKE LIPASE/ACYLHYDROLASE-RELATED n=1 Tax=Salix viminalis TaxID=40686 RepID=A0A9Q0NPJ2_SALVM|nr:GDSL-LIKE LIPASE/ACYLHYDROLASE-RELATED [Salix viminalis]